MAGIPMSAREQLRLAAQFGHELYIEEGTRVRCSCGYRSTTRRSRSALNSTMAWHLGKAIADGVDQVNGKMNSPPDPGVSRPRAASGDL